MCCLVWQRSPDLRLDRFGASISEERHYACVSHSFARVLRTFIKTTSATGSPYTCRHSPGGEIGRHSGLKIRRRQNVVPVRVGSGAPITHAVRHGHSLTWEGSQCRLTHAVSAQSHTKPHKAKGSPFSWTPFELERDKRLELSTYTLARYRSTN